MRAAGCSKSLFSLDNIHVSNISVSSLNVNRLLLKVIDQVSATPCLDQHLSCLMLSLIPQDDRAGKLHLKFRCVCRVLPLVSQERMWNHFPGLLLISLRIFDQIHCF